MGLLLSLSIGLAAVAAAAFVVTREMTARSIALTSFVALMAAAAFALLGAPYLAAVEALVGAALAPCLLLVSLRAAARASQGVACPPPQRVPERRRLVGASVAAAVFLALVTMIRSSSTIQGSRFEAQSILPRDVASIGKELLETQLIGFEAVAALFLVGMIAALHFSRGAFRAAGTRTSETES